MSERPTRKGRPPADPAAVRRRLVEAARAVLAEAGAEGTTMLAVAGRARLSKETVYALVASKEALIAAVAHDAADRLRDDLAARLADGAVDLPVALRTFGEELLTATTAPERVAIDRALAMAVVTDPAIVAALAERESEPASLLVAALKTRGRVDGAVAADAADAYLALLFGDWRIRRATGLAAAPDAATIAARAARATRAIASVLKR